MDKDRIIKRTQLKRNAFKVCGKQIESPTTQTDLISSSSSSSAKDRHLKDYDEEIFDDQDFYNQLLRELIDRKSSCLSDPIELSRRSIELQKLRANNKRKVDTKASKGRKIKFDTHKPLVNFMAPIYRMKMPEEAR
jgi:protein AATF/BFR2